MKKLLLLQVMMVSMFLTTVVNVFAFTINSIGENTIPSQATSIDWDSDELGLMQAGDYVYINNLMGFNAPPIKHYYVGDSWSGSWSGPNFNAAELEQVDPITGTPLYLADLEFDGVSSGAYFEPIAGWGSDNLWHQVEDSYVNTITGGGMPVSPTPEVWWFGREVGAGFYEYTVTNSTTTGFAREMITGSFGPINSGESLLFNSWAETENSPPYYDVRIVSISTDNGETWPISLYLGPDIPSIEGVWEPIAIPLDQYVGQNLIFKFTFDTRDEILNEFRGWFVDDIDVGIGDVDSDGYNADIDCNDYDPTINPGAIDIACDGIDQDCSGSDAVDPTCTDEDTDGYPADVDCNDSNPSINPGATDITCDGIDQDCSGSDAVGPTCTDEDADGYTADVDCNDSEPAINPGATDITCDGIDQDCSGSDAVDPTCTDNDADGYTADIDCNDGNPAINPGAVDIPPSDGIDQDCSGSDASCSDYGDKSSCNNVLACKWSGSPTKGSCKVR